MRRRLAVPLIAVLPLVAAACGNQDDVEGSDEEPVVTSELDQAVEIAQLSLPATLADDVVAGLIEDLCTAAGSGEVEAVVAQLQGADLDPAALDAIAAGAGTYCDDDVDAVVPQVQQAIAPAPPTTAAPEVAASSGGAGTGSGSRSSAGPTSGATGSGGGGSTSGSTGSSSSGSASAGGGNASGTGNQSSTDFTQGVGSSNSSSSSGSGGSSSSSSTTG